MMDVDNLSPRKHMKSNKAKAASTTKPAKTVALKDLKPKKDAKGGVRKAGGEQQDF